MGDNFFLSCVNNTEHASCIGIVVHITLFMQHHFFDNFDNN